jgi:hypothetical protein
VKILCSGYLVRYPLGGFSWHHLQYLIGFSRMGHEVSYFEDHGWSESCFDPGRNIMTADPSYGVAYLETLFRRHGLADRWCYLAEDGTVHGLPRPALAELCATCDVYFNLSNINWIPELERCRRRVLVDTDPVFTQIGGHGSGGPWSRYDACFTYGENVHRPGCDMPTAGARWLPTRQPVVLDLWDVVPPDAAAPFTTLMNWSAYGEHQYAGRVYGQKDREFEPYFSLPHDTGEPMEIAVEAPDAVRDRLLVGGWTIGDPLVISRDPATYQAYVRDSRAEFCVAKHGYVSTNCGWFSDRTAGYLASGRPAVVQDTGFTDFLPSGSGLLAYRKPEEAVKAIHTVRDDYDRQSRSARALAEAYFESSTVLSTMLTRAV